MTANYDIVVVGGGIVGLALAAMLARGTSGAALQVTVVDAATRPEFDPGDDVALRVSAIANGSVRILQQCGAWQSVQETRASAFEHMHVWDAADEPASPSALHFDAAEFAVPQLGFIVENSLLQHALLQVLDASGTKLCFGSPLAAMQRSGDRYRIELEDGRTLDADLLVAADGAASAVRESAGIEVTQRTYEQVAFVTHLQPARPHANTAWQRFLADGPLGMLPLADGRISVVWSTTPAIAERALASDDEALGSMLGDASDHVLGELRVAGPRATFPLHAQHAREYVRERLALVGDAAHAVHPLAGQGANLGLQDARTLCTVLEEAIAKGEHPGDLPVLRRYERARKGANTTMLHFMTGLNSLFGSGSPLVGDLRRAGMHLFNQSGPLRRRVVDVALGDRVER